MALLLILIMIHAVNGNSICNDTGNLKLTEHNTLELSIFSSSNLLVTITDRVGVPLSCNMSATNAVKCYIECSYQNFSNGVNFNESQELTLEICVKNVSSTKYEISTGISSNCIVVPCFPFEISELLKEKMNNTTNVRKNLENILNIKRMCSDVFENETVVDNYIGAERNAIHGIINLPFSNQSQNYSYEDLALTVFKMNLSTTDDLVPVNVPMVFNSTQIVQTWIPTKPFQNVTEEQNKVGIVAYESNMQFKLKLGKKKFESNVIRIEVPGRDIVNLINPLKINFPVNNYTPSANYNHYCQFYDEKGEKTWKDNGCTTHMISDYVVQCSCNHMTPFAVLLIERKISGLHWKILSYISYIGCSLSAVFCAFSILSYIVNSKARTEVSISIHVSLSGALFLLNVSFMLSEGAAHLGINGVCVFIAVVIHYSLLCSFTWMAIEAMHLYLLLIRVFNIYIKHYMLKMSLVGWGIPAIVVGGLLTVYKSDPFYGTKAVTLSDTNETTETCWIKEPLIIYGVNLPYFTLVFLFNTGVLITISRQIFKLRKMDNKHNRLPAFKDVGTVLALMCLLGTTWGLAYFSSAETNYPILYLFCIFNSMQGFCIFLWMFSKVRKNKQEASDFKAHSTVATSK